METWIILLNTLLEVVLILCGLYLIFFKDYFSQKGKNLATKEDIGEITKKVEEIKSEINENSLKKQDAFFEFRKSVIEYNNELVKWVEFTIKDIAIVNNDPWDIDGIQKKLYNLQSQATNVQIAYWKTYIYINIIDEDWFLKIWRELLRINKLHKLTLTLLEQAYSFSSRLKISKNNLEINNKILSEIAQANEKFIKDRDDIEGESFDALKNTANLIREKLRMRYNIDVKQKLD